MRAIPHFRALDGVRGVAALLVAVYHCWVLTGYVTLDDGHGRSVLGAGYVGVDVFFVLSGFVLFVPMASHPEHPVELRSYARRRAARIVPAYLLALSVAIVFNPWVSLAPADLPWQSWAGLRSLVAHLLFLHQLLGGSTDQTGFGAVGSVWTLSLEASFYLLLPFVARPFLRRPLVGVTVGLSAAAAWRAFVMHVVTAGTATVGDGFVWGTQLPTYLGHFALGMGGAVAVVHIRTCPRWRRAARSLAPVVTLTSLATLLVLMDRAGRRGLTGSAGPLDHYFRNTAVAAASAILIVGLAVGAGRTTRWATTQPMTVLANASYGIYLFHLPLIGLAVHAGLPTDGRDLSFFWLAAGVVPASIAFGWASFRWLEEPARRWARVGSPAHAPTSCPGTGVGAGGPETRHAVPLARNESAHTSSETVRESGSRPEIGLPGRRSPIECSREHGANIARVRTGDVSAELHDRHQQRQQDDDQSVADDGGIDVTADRACELLGAKTFGASFTQLGQRWDLEHPVRDAGLEPAQQPASQGPPLDRRYQREEQGLRPVAVTGLAEGGCEPFVDERSGVLVQGGEEQRLLVGKVGVGDTPSYTGVPGDVSD
jgi:peptidoglycan/LPS O-acetylase OafA/YrhL